MARDPTQITRNLFYKVTDAIKDRATRQAKLVRENRQHVRDLQKQIDALNSHLGLMFGATWSTPPLPDSATAAAVVRK